MAISFFRLMFHDKLDVGIELKGRTLEEALEDAKLCLKDGETGHISNYYGETVAHVNLDCGQCGHCDKCSWGLN